PHNSHERLTVIIARSPLRISLGGGGTDLPSYYREYGGFLIAAAIDKAVYVTVHRTFLSELVVRYSKIERVPGPRDVHHPIGSVAVSPLEISEDTLREFEVRVLLFSTGIVRQAPEILKDQDDRTKQRSAEMVQNLHHIKEIGYESKAVLEAGRLDAYGALLHE